MRSCAILLLLLPQILFSDGAFSQGCSDAGFCSAGSMKAGANINDFSSGFQITEIIGLGEEHVFISTTQIELKLLTHANGRVNIRAPFTFVSGDLGNNAGFGDLQVSYTLRKIVNDSLTWAFVAGFKYFSGDSDALNKDDLPLPMPYQTSLGTNDLIFGVNMFYRKWHFAMGYQRVFGTNKNQFTHKAWNNDTHAVEYFESGFLERGDDIMMRFQRMVEREKATWTFGLLPIYRLQKDIIEIDSVRVPLNGSNQLTLNINVGSSMPLSDKSVLKFNLGFPTLFRKVRADGLTRLLVFSSAVEFKF